MKMMNAGASLVVLSFFLSGCGGGGPSIPAPSELAVDAFSPDFVSISWKDNSQNEDGFNIYRSSGGGAFTPIGTNFFASYNDNTVTQGVTYQYRVTAYNAEEESCSSNTVSVVPDDYYITLLTPNGDEQLTVGQMYDISWVTNMPGFDARITLSLDGGATLPGGEVLFFSGGEAPSPIQWKVGYKNEEQDPHKPPNWTLIVGSEEDDCVIRIEHYWDSSVSDNSDSSFTISP